MRVAIALLLCLGFASPASAGAFPAPPAQCGGYQDILDYFDLVTVFSGGGLTAQECSRLCKRTAKECQASIGRAQACSKKAESSAARRDIAYVCAPLEGQEKRDCKDDYRSYYEGNIDEYAAGALTARAGCDSIGQACVADCD
jgi:hypothetical protein